MAENLQFQINYAGGGYVDANVSVSKISELVDKFDFIGQSVHMTEAFSGIKGVTYPIDFWMTPKGEDIKWEIKTMPSLENLEDLENFKDFAKEFKNILGYYPLTEGYSVIAGGEIYVFDVDENGDAVAAASEFEDDLSANANE